MSSCDEGVQTSVRGARDASGAGVSAAARGARRRVVVLGSTGSIGTQTLDVIAQHADRLEAVGLAVFGSVDALGRQAREFGVRHLAVGDERLAGDARCDDLAAWCAAAPEGTFGTGGAAVVDLVRLPEVDVVVNALVGEAGMRASYEALAAGKVLALANKESLVVAGDLIMPLAAELDARRRAEGLAPAFGPAGALMPIDSEHGAIYQCLLGEDPREVTRLWVTASGGPFRGRTRDELSAITPAQALAHPTWNMGAKISIDSSTLMNKGLEVIEAHHLFAMPYDQIEVVVQPQSAIHSMVEFADGSVKAHLGTTDMRIPIQFALSYPERWGAPVRPMDFRTLGTLEFAAPDVDTFRCLALARHAGAVGGTLPCAMNAANEVAVAAFLAEECPYLGIAACVEAVMDAHEREGVQRVEGLDQLEAVDAWSREAARAWVRAHGA
ncbi:1-deoxy-D-xylulose-5-phosphate reductoisomerase [Adlercreutzia faecimuris]|uniref:1-deoxy-D-xylulose 5-phosphate reductoisomerase n=1 Tax=Adlercreutzia faecimuris TaxID=2897341 RepID=A0ABS9WJW5_9ACTN|nr:1-deoxy-D-xylulose-5-phosphate reductoisomerase [Adlercreutzia sp. JBNU-10]MCI2242837.1 1-deoxy-D-xylulose-5-phosphate reductoisomerase [Adlercreutzia sp. JBNU-10]